MDKEIQPIQEKKSPWFFWLVVGIIVIILAVIIFYYIIMNRGETYNETYDFSDPKYETESFEINILDVPQLYESGFAFNCTSVIIVEVGENYPINMLIKGHNRLSSMSLYFMEGNPMVMSLDTTKEHYGWHIYPNGSIKPMIKSDEPYEYPKKNLKESNFTWLCQKTELNDNIFQPPKGVDFGAVSISKKELEDFEKIFE